MDNSHSFVDPNADFDENNPLREDAVNYRATNKHGKKCLLVDNTGKQLNEADCREILDSLIENDIFGFRTLSASGGDTISLERRESTHVQVGEDLYRLIVFRYEARIELF
ncbi:MAG: hypothetical protein ACYC3O_08105 [Burkholderiales bacterium]